MATDMQGSWLDGPLTDGDREPVAGARHGRARWTAAHAEAARFVGECIGAGAVLGMVAAMRPRKGD